MKKKICVCLGVIITLLFVLSFYFIGSIKKTPISPEEYFKVSKLNNIQAQDVTNYLDEESKQYISKAIESGIGTFEECKNLEAANFLFDTHDKQLKYKNQQIGNTKYYDITEFSNNHYHYKSYSTSHDYIVIIKVENTVIQLIANKSYKASIDKFAKELGYDLDVNINILSAPMMVAGIFATLLSLVYTILIFKNNKVNPILALVPFVNFYFMCKIADKSGWKMLLFLIPFLNILYYFILMYKLTKRYTDSKLMSLGMGFLPLVLLPLIAFDEPKNNENTKNVYQEILKEEGID